MLKGNTCLWICLNILQACLMLMVLLETCVCFIKEFWKGHDSWRMLWGRVVWIPNLLYASCIMPLFLSFMCFIVHDNFRRRHLCHRHRHPRHSHPRPRHLRHHHSHPRPRHLRHHHHHHHHHQYHHHHHHHQHHHHHHHHHLKSFTAASHVQSPRHRPTFKSAQGRARSQIFGPTKLWLEPSCRACQVW